MNIVIAQRAQILQTLGSIATSAANAATEGIAEASKTDPKTVNTALKLFGGFDRIEFENINGAPVPNDGTPPNLLTPAVRPPASYEAPAEYLKPLSNTVEGQGLLVPAKDLLQQLEDPRFRMADGLSGFSDNRITQTLAQKGMIINSKPGGDVSLGRLDENGIIVIGDGKPADPGDMAASLDSFGKLYMMENTVGKQLQLHEQLDLGALGNFSGAKQNPRLDLGLKGIPDTRTLNPRNIQDLEILNLPLDHALNGTPQTLGEMAQMLDVMIVKMEEIIRKMDGPANIGMKAYAGFIQYYLSKFQDECQNLPPNSSPTEELLAEFEKARLPCKYFLSL